MWGRGAPPVQAEQRSAGFFPASLEECGGLFRSLFSRRNIPAMSRHFMIALLLLASTAAFAQKPQAPSSEQLAAITARGKLLYEYDQAAWHATDALQPSTIPKGAVDGYVARKTDNGWVVMWGRFTPSRDKFLIVYEAVQTAKPELFRVEKHDPPIEDAGFYLNAFRAIDTGRQDFHGENRPYNFAVLPAENRSFFVYILPAQTVEDVYPMGGDVRYLVSSDGLHIIAKRRMHQDIINITVNETTPFSLHTHILSDSAEDSDVFNVLTRHPRIPEYIATCDFSYVISSQGSIQATQLKACGKECEDYVAKLTSFQAFRKAGCPDMAGNP